MSQQLVPLPKSQGLVPTQGNRLATPPAVITAAGERAKKRFREFFTANMVKFAQRYVKSHRTALHHETIAIRFN